MSYTIVDSLDLLLPVCNVIQDGVSHMNINEENTPLRHIYAPSGIDMALKLTFHDEFIHVALPKYR